MPFAREALGVRPDPRAIDPQLGGALEPRRKRLDGWFGDEHARLAVDDGFKRAAAAKCHHRSTARLRLDRHDAEVLLAREQDGSGPPIFVANLLVSRPADELDV